MLWYLARRVVRLVASLIAVSLLTFGILQLIPGSFSELADISASTALGDQAVVQDVQLVERYSEEVPAWEQYLTFMKGVATWDMGPSYKYKQTAVEDMIAEALPVSMSLAVPATLLALLIAVPMGVLAAVKKDKPADYGSMFVLTAIQAWPAYLFALIMVLIFVAWLSVLPFQGWEGPEYMIIPVVALAVQPAAILARYVRSSMLEALREEYVVAAYAKGGVKRTVLVRHVLRNSLIPLTTVVGPMFANLVTGVVVIESIMGIPGLGRLFTSAARQRDIPLLMGATLFFALILMVLNLIVDMLYGALDPRIRHQQGGSWRRPKRPRPGAPASHASSPQPSGDGSPPEWNRSSDVSVVVRP